MEKKIILGLIVIAGLLVVINDRPTGNIAGMAGDDTIQCAAMGGTCMNIQGSCTDYELADAPYACSSSPVFSKNSPIFSKQKPRTAAGLTGRAVAGGLKCCMECYDTDGGEIFDTFGTATGERRDNGFGIWDDFCEYPDQLVEFSCSGNGMVEISNSRCFCKNGECVTELFCQESDDGNDPYHFGITFGFYNHINGSYRDDCTGNNYVREFYCNLDDGTVQDTAIICEGGCFGGECVPI